MGGRDFSLLGRPILPRDLVKVEATVVEKNVAKTEIHFPAGARPRRSKTYCKLTIYIMCYLDFLNCVFVLKKTLIIAQNYFSVSRPRETTLRINCVRLLKGVEEAKDRVGFELRDDNPAFL